MTLENYIKSVLSGVKTWVQFTFAKKKDFNELNDRIYRSEWTEKFLFKNISTSPEDNYDNQVYISHLEKPYDENWVNDIIYVEWDGVKYECKAFNYYDRLTFGNKSIINIFNDESFVDTKEPFLIQIYDNQYINFFYTVPGNHIVSISYMSEKIYNKIDQKYLNIDTIGAEGTGENAEVFNDYSYNKASGEYSHAEGCRTTASGDYAHAEGLYTTASNYGSHAEGIGTIASGEYSHAEGESTIASGKRSHAEGGETVASGVDAHAEGWQSVASGTNSHAEGLDTTASGNYSHAEGSNTDAIGESSHAEGGGSVASGIDAHAEGRSTKASSNYQHVQGKYNIEDVSNTYAHIVGNGSYTARSNAHTLDWDGNAWFAGDVYVGSTSGINKDGGSKKLVTLEDVNVVKDGIVLKDTVNGYNYIIQMKNGNLVSSYACDHIELTAMPTKTNYMRGEAFDTTGMIVTAVMQDGSTKIIEDYSYSEYVISDSVEVKYTEGGIAHTVSISVTVTEFDAATALIDFEYTTNNDGTYTITAWKQTLNGVSSTEMVIPNNHLINI